MQKHDRPQESHFHRALENDSVICDLVKKEPNVHVKSQKDYSSSIVPMIQRNKSKRSSMNLNHPMIYKYSNKEKI